MAALLGIGTATFLPGYGPTASRHPGPSLLSSALNYGVMYVDTAAVYGGSEAAIGQVADAVDALGVRVATKLRPASHTPEDYQVAMRASLERLRLEQVDTVMLHSASAELLTSPAVSASWQTLRQSALARKLGASTYGVADARTAVALPWCDAVQVEFSIVNQSVIKALREVASRHVEVIARSVLCKGLLTPSAMALTLPSDARETLTRLQSVADRLGMDLTALAIRFALDTPGIDVVLVGVSDVGELDVAVRAWRSPSLSPADYDEVAAFDRTEADWAHPERWPGGRPAA